MIKEDLLKMPHLAIAEEKPNMFVHVHTEDGYFITSFMDGDDILKYSSSMCMYMPIMDTYADYRVITAAENDAYMEANRKAVEEDMKKMEEERNLNK